MNIERLEPDTMKELGEKLREKLNSNYSLYDFGKNDDGTPYADVIINDKPIPEYTDEELVELQKTESIKLAKERAGLM